MKKEHDGLYKPPTNFDALIINNPYCSDSEESKSEDGDETYQ